MSWVEPDGSRVNFKIVYYGPALAGKTANLRHIHDATPEADRAKLTSPASDVDRHILFDLSPRTRDIFEGLPCRIHLHAAPGAIFHARSKLAVLDEADGIVFVADSQSWQSDANVESLEELRSNLMLHGQPLESLPLVLQRGTAATESSDGRVAAHQHVGEPAGPPDLVGAALLALPFPPPADAGA